MKLNEAGLKQILNFKQLEKLLRNYSLTSGMDVARRAVVRAQPRLYL